MGTLQLRAEFFDIYLDLAVEFGLPLRLSGASTESLIGFPFRSLAAEEGVVFPDHFVYVRRAWAAAARSRRRWPPCRRGSPRCTSTPRSTRPSCGPSPRTGRRGSTTWPSSATTAALADALDRAGAHRIGFRPLRELQRAG